MHSWRQYNDTKWCILIGIQFLVWNTIDVFIERNDYTPLPIAVTVNWLLLCDTAGDI